MTQYGFHPDAISDLDEIWEHVRKDNLHAANQLIADVFTEIRALTPFPGRGHKRPDLTSRPLRFVGVREYLIVYAPEPSFVWIVAVLHGRRNPRILAALLRNRNGSTQ